MKKLLSLFAFVAIVISFAACGGKDGNNPEVSNAPEGAINGKFTVGEGKQVYFSKGNLRAIFYGGNWTWEFAKNQWDFIGNKAGNTSINVYGTVLANDTVDLFGWSPDNVGNNFGIKSSTVNSAYAGEFVDWGVRIGEGWYTLSRAEWAYLFYVRNDAPHLFGMGTVNGVKGVILLPDNWAGERFTDTDNGLTDQGSSYYNTAGTNFAFHTFTLGQWIPMQEQGAVFLPAAGERIGQQVISVGSYGHYWSSIPYFENKAYCLNLDANELNPQGVQERFYGHSVRLVKEVE